VWVGHSCPTPLTLILTGTKRPLPEALASNNPEKARAQGSDRSVRPTLHYLTHMGSPFDILGHRADIWLFLILALSTVAVALVGLAAYLRVRSHMKESSSRETHGKE